MTRAEQAARRVRVIAAIHAGEFVRDVAAREGISRYTIYSAFTAAGLTFPPEIRAASASEAMTRKNADPEFQAARRAKNLFEVPAWVIDAGLREEYTRHARVRGEEYAASICRALKANRAYAND